MIATRVAHGVTAGVHLVSPPPAHRVYLLVGTRERVARSTPLHGVGRCGQLDERVFASPKSITVSGFGTPTRLSFVTR
jgi:hypothetical protein